MVESLAPNNITFNRVNSITKKQILSLKWYFSEDKLPINGINITENLVKEYFKSYEDDKYESILEDGYWNRNEFYVLISYSL